VYEQKDDCALTWERRECHQIRVNVTFRQQISRGNWW